MSTFLHWLFFSQSFMPHGHCFLWQPTTLWLNVLSDGLIAASYFAIPVVIYCYTWRRRHDISFSWLPLMFALFILLCGTTHVMEIVTVWDPQYRLAGVLKLFTGLISLATTVSLVWVLPRALLLKSPRQLDAEVRAQTDALQAANIQLRAEIAARDAAEASLRVEMRDHARSLSLLRTIVESAPTLIYAKDRNGRMLLANPPALELIGKTWEQVAGRTDREFLSDGAQGEAVSRNDQHLMSSGRTQTLEEAVGVAPDGEARIWYSVKAPLRDETGAVLGLVGVSVEITERQRLEYRLRLMVDELNHRVKNTLTTVLAIAAQSLRGAPVALYTTLQNRLLSLAAAHDVLTRERWAGADLYALVVAQLAPFGGIASGRFAINGPRLRLAPRAAVALAMSLHELATNALKHGALSIDSGKIAIDWRVTTESEPKFLLSWTERNGPAVHVPSSTGFGTLLLQRSLARDLSAEVRLNFADPQGITCSVETLLSRITAPTSVQPLPQVGTLLGSSA